MRSNPVGPRPPGKRLLGRESVVLGASSSALRAHLFGREAKRGRRIRSFPCRFVRAPGPKGLKAKRFLDAAHEGLDRRRSWNQSLARFFRLRVEDGFGIAICRQNMFVSRTHRKPFLLSEVPLALSALVIWMACDCSWAQLATDQVPRERTVPSEETVKQQVSNARLRLGPLRILPTVIVTSAGYDNNVHDTPETCPPIT